MKSCMQMPRKPRVAMASPTFRGKRPRPPVKWNGRWVGEDAGETGVERNINQRLLKVPRCVAIKVCAIRVQITLWVNMRRKGSFLFVFSTNGRGGTWRDGGQFEGKGMGGC